MIRIREKSNDYTEVRQREIINLHEDVRDSLVLTERLSINVFKVVYRRHTNFAIEAIEQTLKIGSKSSQLRTIRICRRKPVAIPVW